MAYVFLFLLLAGSSIFAMNNNEQSELGDVIIFHHQLVIGENVSNQDGRIITTTVTRKIWKSDFTVVTSQQKHSGARSYITPDNSIVVERLKQKANALVRKKIQEAFLEKQASAKQSKSLLPTLND